MIGLNDCSLIQSATTNRSYGTKMFLFQIFLPGSRPDGTDLFCFLQVFPPDTADYAEEKSA